MASDTPTVPFRVVEGKGGRDVYLIQGHLLNKDRQKGNKLYVRCHKWRSGCPGRATLDLPTRTVLAQVEHRGNHNTNSEEVLLRQFRHLLKTYAKECSSGMLKECYERAAAEMPQAAVLLPYVRVVRSMNNWRREAWPRNPKTAEETLRLFESGHAQGAQFAEHFYCGGSSEEGTYLLFANLSNTMMSKLAQTRVLHADGTFRSAPKQFFQVLFLFLEAHDVILPFAIFW